MWVITTIYDKQIRSIFLFGQLNLHFCCVPLPIAALVKHCSKILRTEKDHDKKNENHFLLLSIMISRMLFIFRRTLIKLWFHEWLFHRSKIDAFNCSTYIQNILISYFLLLQAVSIMFVCCNDECSSKIFEIKKKYALDELCNKNHPETADWLNF